MVTERRAGMTDNQRRAASDAADREWHWANPRCPSCERNHPPDRCDLADEAEDGWPWYGWEP